MVSYSLFKNTFLFSFILMAACGNSVSGTEQKSDNQKAEAINTTVTPLNENELIVGAENYKNCYSCHCSRDYNDGGFNSYRSRTAG